MIKQGVLTCFKCYLITKIRYNSIKNKKVKKITKVIKRTVLLV